MTYRFLLRLAAALPVLLPVVAGASRRAPAPAPVAAVSAGALVDNVTGITLDGEGRVVRFTGLLMTPDGHVVRLLGAGDKRPERLDWRADMKGRVMLPGFVDADGHIMDLGFRALELDLSAATSLADAQGRIAAYAAANADRNWVIGGGWNQEAWRLGRFPTAADLAGIAADRPIVLDRADAHAVWLNEAAMKALGLTAATPAPANGRILRGPGNAPTGVFVDAARDMVLKLVPQPRAVDRDGAFLKAQAILLANGVTAVADVYTHLSDWLTFRRIADQGGLRIRIEGYADSIDTANLTAGKGPSPWLYGDRLRLIGVAMFADGTLGSRGACLKAPYADAPAESGRCFLGDDRLRNLMSRAAMDGFQVAVHAIGDRANAEVLSAIEDLSETYAGDRRWRVEHAQIVDPADLPRFGRHGIVASMQPVDLGSDWRMAEARLGPDRLGGAYAWGSMLRGGAALAFGSGFPVEKPDPFAGWAAAIGREDAGGQPPGGWHPGERLTREQAWQALTAGAAHAGFAEKVFGGLAPGQRADFIIVDRDPLLASAADLRGTRVEETWVSGEKVWQQP